MSMFKSWFMGAALALAVIGASAVAAGEAQAPETKRIGVVFVDQVFENYNYAKDTQERVKTTFEPERLRIEEEAKRIQQLERELQNNPLKPPGSAPWRRSMVEIETAKVEIQAMQEDFVKRIQEEQTALVLNVYNALQRACKALGEHYDYDLIITSPSASIPAAEALESLNPLVLQQELMSRNIQFVNDRANLTMSIIMLLNNRYQLHLQDPQKNPTL